MLVLATVFWLSRVSEHFFWSFSSSWLFIVFQLFSLEISPSCLLKHSCRFSISSESILAKRNLSVKFLCDKQTLHYLGFLLDFWLSKVLTPALPTQLGFPPWLSVVSDATLFLRLPMRPIQTRFLIDPDDVDTSVSSSLLSVSMYRKEWSGTSSRFSTENRRLLLLTDPKHGHKAQNRYRILTVAYNQLHLNFQMWG